MEIYVKILVFSFVKNTNLQKLVLMVNPIVRLFVCWYNSLLNVNAIPFVQYKNSCFILLSDKQLFSLFNNTFVDCSITLSIGIDKTVFSMSRDIIKKFLL